MYAQGRTAWATGSGRTRGPSPSPRCGTPTASRSGLSGSCSLRMGSMRKEGPGSFRRHDIAAFPRRHGAAGIHSMSSARMPRTGSRTVNAPPAGGPAHAGRPGRRTRRLRAGPTRPRRQRPGRSSPPEPPPGPSRLPASGPAQPQAHGPLPLRRFGAAMPGLILAARGGDRAGSEGEPRPLPAAEPRWPAEAPAAQRPGRKRAGRARRCAQRRTAAGSEPSRTRASAG